MKNAIKMTEGNIFKCIIYFAIPILIGNIFQQLYNVADVAIIGHILGDDALAAVGAVTPVYGLLIGLASGITNGFAVIIARFFGADNEKEMNKAVALTYVLSGIMALILTMVSLIYIRPLMKYLNTPDEIIDNSVAYMRIIVIFIVITIAYNMMAGMMRAIGNSKAPLYFLVISTLINVGLDFLLVKGFNMGVEGAAYATVISQGIAVVLCFIYALNKCNFLIFRKKNLSWDGALIIELVNTGLSMGVMYAIVSVGSIILQGAVNSFGKATITAHTAARKIDDIFMMLLGTTAMASSTFASQNFGAGKMDRVKNGIKCSILIAEFWSLLSLVIALTFRKPLIQALTNTSNPEVIATASKYILWNIPFFFVLSILLVLRSSLQGVGRKIVPITGSIVEFVMKVVAVKFLAPWLGYFGICILEPIIWIVCALIVIGDFIVFTKQIKGKEVKIRKQQRIRAKWQPQS